MLNLTFCEVILLPKTRVKYQIVKKIIYPILCPKNYPIFA